MRAVAGEEEAVAAVQEFDAAVVGQEGKRGVDQSGAAPRDTGEVES